MMTVHQYPPTPGVARPSSKLRQRVSKACDRCRLKKAKCDGGNPCGRCTLYNTVCIFGKKSKIKDKRYPKGYAAMLEQQQKWLVYGLQKLYRRTCEGRGWLGEPLRCGANGHPLTHDLLTRLGAVDQSEGKCFEESMTDTQQKPQKQNAQCIEHRGSPAYFERSQHSTVPALSCSPSARQLPHSSLNFSLLSRQSLTMETNSQLQPNISASVGPLTTYMDGDGLAALHAPQQVPTSLDVLTMCDSIETSDPGNWSWWLH